MGNVTGYDLKKFYNGILKTQNPLYSYQFIAEFIGLNDAWGITDPKDAQKNITYYVQSASIPGRQMATGSVEYLGKKFSLPGPAKYNHTWTCNILLEQSLTPYKGFRRWQEDIASLKRDGGGNKAVPNVKIRLSVLDASGLSKTQAVVLEGVWCQSVGEMSLSYKDGGGSPIKSFPITLAYQYNYLDNDKTFDGNSTDPFRA